MKNLAIKLTTCAAISLAVFSCKNDGVKNEDPEQYPVVIETGINSSRAYDATWEYGDAIGVTMYNPDSTEIIDNQFNEKYVTVRNLGLFYAENSDETLYFPLNGDDVYIKGYYPFIADLASNMQVSWSVEDQSVLQDIDLMTSKHVAGYNKEDAAVRLHFYHRLVKMVFLLNVADDNDAVQLNECTLIIHGLQTGNTYDLFADNFLNAYQGIDDITVPLRDGEDGNERVGIVLPRPAGEGVIFEFVTPSGDSYTAFMSETLELKKGNKYTFVVTLSQNPAIVSATIEPWIDNDYEYYIAH